MQTLILMLMTVVPHQLAAEKTDGSTATEDEKLKAAVATMAKEVSARCEFTVGEPQAAKLIQHPEPILRWSNPTAGKVFGEVYVWTDNGRPAVVASLYRWFSPDWGRTLEVCSLSDRRATGRLADARFWVPDRPGLAFKPIADVDPPAKSPAARLVQMRRIAGDFTANLADTRGGASGVKRQLRLLSQPVFRYLPATEKSPYADGALFAFVEGTDPEVLLLLEATKADGAAHWRFGLARMNRDALVVTLRDAIVWTAPHIENPLGLSQEPYAMFSLDHSVQEVGDAPRQAQKKEAKP